MEEKSVMFKEEGNQLFRKKSYESAIVMYNRSIEIIPSAVWYAKVSI